MTTPVETCGTCRFAQGDECHRHPPTAAWDTNERFNGDYPAEVVTIWPTVHTGDWCGEYQPTPEAMRERLAGMKRRED